MAGLQGARPPHTRKRRRRPYFVQYATGDGNRQSRRSPPCVFTHLSPTPTRASGRYLTRHASKGIHRKGGKNKPEGFHNYPHDPTQNASIPIRRRPRKQRHQTLRSLSPPAPVLPGLLAPLSTRLTIHQETLGEQTNMTPPAHAANQNPRSQSQMSHALPALL